MSSAVARGDRPLSRFRDELRDLVFHSSSALVMRAVRSLSSFAFNLVLARLLGAGGTGAYFLAFGVTEVATLIARMGMDPTVVRLVAGGEGRSRSFYRRVLTLVTLVGLLMTGIVQAAAPFVCIRFFSEPALIEPLRIMAFGIVPWALIFIHGSLLQSAGRIGLSIFVHHAALFLAGIPFLWMFAWSGSLDGAALARVAAAVSVLVTGVFLWRRTTNEGFALSDQELPPGRWRAAMVASLSLFLIGLLITISGLADTFILGMQGTVEDVGTFRVAFRVAVLGGAALEAVRAVIAPRIAAYHRRGELQAMEQTGRAAAALAAAISAPYWLIVLVFPAEILSIFGQEFTVGAAATTVLMVGRMVTTILGPAAIVLVMAGLERPLRDLAIVFTTLRVVLLWFVIPVWGVLGAAVVGCVLDISGSIAATVLAHRKLGILILPLPRRLLPYRVDPPRSKRDV